MSSALDHVADLAAYLTASPSSFHAAAEGATRLAAAGFAEQDETADFDVSPGGHYLVRDGALLAWRLPSDPDPRTPYRIVGAHTDSPGFAVKPNPDLGGDGYQQGGGEGYRGAPLHPLVRPAAGVGRPDRQLVDHLADLVDCAPDEIDGLDLMAYDAAPPAVFGPDQEFLAAG